MDLDKRAGGEGLPERNPVPQRRPPIPGAEQLLLKRVDPAAGHVQHLLEHACGLERLDCRQGDEIFEMEVAAQQVVFRGQREFEVFGQPADELQVFAHGLDRVCRAVLL